MWRSWLAHHVRDVGVVCSSQIIPTKRKEKKFFPLLFFNLFLKKINKFTRFGYKLLLNYFIY